MERRRIRGGTSGRSGSRAHPAHPMPGGTRDVFFYGLFMDEELLRGKGVDPQLPRRAVVNGYRLRIGQRAMLEPRYGAQAFGMVFALTDREIESLYSEPGLDKYRPEPVVASFDDGRTGTVTTYNLADVSAAGAPDAEYAARLRAVLERLSFPVDTDRAAGLE